MFLIPHAPDAAGHMERRSFISVGRIRTVRFGPVADRAFSEILLFSWNGKNSHLAVLCSVKLLCLCCSALCDGRVRAAILSPPLPCMFGAEVDLGILLRCRLNSFRGTFVAAVHISAVHVLPARRCRGSFVVRTLLAAEDFFRVLCFRLFLPLVAGVHVLKSHFFGFLSTLTFPFFAICTERVISTPFLMLSSELPQQEMLSPMSHGSY